MPVRLVVSWILLAAMYTLAGKLGLALAFVNQSATAVWPPTGIALAAVLLLGPRVWPGIFLGAFITNETTAGSLTTSLLIASGNTLEAVLGGYLVNRFAAGRSAFDHGWSIARFVLLAGFVSTGVSATIGVTTLSLFRFSEWSSYGTTWLTWWLGDAAAAIVVTPALVLWAAERDMRRSRDQWRELSAFVAMLLAVGWVVFVASDYPLGFLCIPLCVWAAGRFGRREAAIATCLLSLIAVWGTVQGVGTFARDSVNDALLLLQGFMAVTSVIGLIVGAAVWGRKVAEERLHLAYAELESRVESRTKELQTALHTLRVSDARFSEAQQVANVGSWELNVRDGNEYWSDQMYRIFGVDPGSVTPSFEAFTRFLHPDDRKTVDRIIRQALVNHQPFQCDNRIIRKDGEIRNLHVQGRVVLDGNDEVIRFVGTTQDITARQRAEETVRRSEHRLQTIIDAEPACVKVVSGSGLLLDMNPAGLKMIGARSLDEIAQQPVIDLVHPDDRDRFRAMHQDVCNGSPGRLEFRIVGLDGQLRWVDSHAVPFEAITDNGDTRAAVLSVTSDVTERKRLEDELLQSQKMEAVGLLAGGIAHDFNNLLTAIGGYTDLVLESFTETDKRREELQEVAKATRRAAALTRQLLAFSRRQILQPTILDVNEMVRDIQRLLRRTIPEHIDLQFEQSVSVHSVRADRGQLEVAILNLAINAADAMPQGGRLRITTATRDVDHAWAKRHPPMPAGRYVCLAVSDTGAGMTPETQTRIFEPFFTTKGPGKGTGLGLATVYGIVKQSEGFIWVDSEVGQGTTFEVYLPAAFAPIPRPVHVPSVAEIGRGLHTILLAEDDGAVRRLARDVLTNQGYTVVDARDGDEALTISREYPGPIHLLIADVVMPGLSGPDLAERLNVERPDTRVLYTSGYTENLMIRAGFEHGLATLAKPFLPADLLRKVSEVLTPAV